MALDTLRIRHGGGRVSPEQLGLLPEEDFPPWSVTHLVQVVAGDFLGGPVERGDPARGIGRKETAADALHAVLVKSVQPAQPALLLDRGLRQRPASPPPRADR